MSHAEDSKSSLYKITELLNGEEQGSVRLIKEALSTVDSLERYYPKAKEIAERLRSAYIDLNDLASETDVLKEDIEFNPERLEWVNERLNTLYTLEQKHRVATVEELIAIQDKYTEQLHDIDSFDEQIDALKGQLDISHCIQCNSQAAGGNGSSAGNAECPFCRGFCFPAGTGKRWNGRYPISFLRQ